MMSATTSVFDDLSDDLLEELQTPPAGYVPPFSEHLRSIPQAAPIFERPTYTEVCRKCNGSGRFVSYTGRIVGQCFTCKGAGKFTRLTSPEVRAKAAVAAQTKKANTMEMNWTTLVAQHPAEAAWIEANASSFDFARSMQDAVAKFGSLTDGQLAAIQRIIASSEARKAAAVERIAAAPVVDTTKLENAFNTARANELKAPRIRVGKLVFSLAKETSANAGAVYVKESGADGEYLGKVMGGKFLKTRACSDDVAATVLRVAADPKAAAIEYGREFGCCSICARTLTDPKSIELGIGPICAGKFGF